MTRTQRDVRVPIRYVFTIIVTMIAAGCASTHSHTPSSTRIIPITTAWSGNSVNAVIFRRNSIVSHEGMQYAAFYDEDAHVVIAARSLDSTEWTFVQTPMTGNIQDAHNSISIMVDGDGYLHLSWDHHGHPLCYCKSITPGALEFGPKQHMVGTLENNVTYPEFYRLPDGNLIFAYRDGGSGRGNLVLNHYDTSTQIWTRRGDAFIHGEGQRNAYWQMCVDDLGTIHVSWVWRETGDVATNHDLCYAKSNDGGVTWLRSDNSAYALPITASNAEYACAIPQNSTLINTTSMCADDEGRPYIASYWTPEGETVPQYQLVFHDGARWQTAQISNRTTPFTLGGVGTKRIPISRCQIVADSSGRADGKPTRAHLIYRDEERGSRVSIATCNDLTNPTWHTINVTDFSVGLWEPSYDTELWRNEKKLHLYVQCVGQGDGEAIEDVEPQVVSVLEWIPGRD